MTELMISQPDGSSHLILDSPDEMECVYEEIQVPLVNLGDFDLDDLVKPLPPRRRKLMEGLRRFFQRRYVFKLVDEVSVASTAASTACSVFSEDFESADDEDEEGVEVPLMQQRLLKTGVVTSENEFRFTTDKVSKEVKHLYENEEEVDEAGVTHVKTGVWQVLTFNEDGSEEEPYYIVTAVSMDDRVDTRKLRKAVFSGQIHKKRPKLAMAPTPIAQELAGYQSGTMAPICHTVPMKMFMEETIANTEPNHELWMGSGMFGKCLAISTEHCLAIASQNPKGFVSCPLIQKKKKTRQ